MIKKTVKSITLSHRQMEVFSLNLIEFTDGTKAEERNDGAGSSFVEGEEACYEITNRGRAGKPDWITRVFGINDKPALPQKPTYTAPEEIRNAFVVSPKDLIIIAQTGMNQAVQLMAMTEGDVNAVIAKGLELSEGILKNAKFLHTKYSNN